ncbi:MAG TPA: DUF58 domain-containing protein [Planctomycetota bacterium]|nr:DUF58 domain-containing protein [Planctomycetota bacterium]
MRAPAEPAAASWQLAWPSQPLVGISGTRLGRGTGASLEFLDSREYVPGDDLRAVDWRAYARSDQLRVRLFREEVAPVLDVIVDVSPSMAVTEVKAAAAADLRAAFVWWGERGGARARVYEIAGPGAPVGLRRGGVRVLVSDLLVPDDPGPLLARLAAGAALLVVVQLLDPAELQPEPDGPVALIDCETGARLEIVLDAPAVARYRERLDRLIAGVAAAARRTAARHATVCAAPLDAMCRSALLPAGIVTVA